MTAPDTAAIPREKGVPSVKRSERNNTIQGEHMRESDWVKELPAAITVCDRSGVILAMNDRACATFAAEGGAGLIGTNLLDCHPGPARDKVATLLASGKTNCYTIEKGRVRKLIYQAPWYKEGAEGGFVELSLPIPEQIPHFVRQ